MMNITQHMSLPIAGSDWWQQFYQVEDEWGRTFDVVYDNETRGAACARCDSQWCRHARLIDAVWARHYATVIEPKPLRLRTEDEQCRYITQRCRSALRALRASQRGSASPSPNTRRADSRSGYSCSASTERQTSHPHLHLQRASGSRKRS